MSSVPMIAAIPPVARKGSGSGTTSARFGPSVATRQYPGNPSPEDRIVVGPYTNKRTYALNGQSSVVRGRSHEIPFKAIGSRRCRAP